MSTCLRAYQVKAAHALQAYVTAGERELLLESPVGSGKTTTVKALAASLLKSGACRLAVVLVPQNMLKDQWAAAGSWRIGRQVAALPEAQVIHEVAELTPDFWRKASGLVVVSRQALTTKRGAAILAAIKRIAGVLVVADEGHHCSDENESGKALASLRSKGVTTLLVSATPFATKGNVGGPNCKAVRFSEVEYVSVFADGDPSQPPSEFVIDRVFVGKPVRDAEATIDRSGTKTRKAAPEEDRAPAMTKAMAKRWAADGFPRAVFNVPLQAWKVPLEKALAKAWRDAGQAKALDLLDLVGDLGDDLIAAAQGHLAAESKVGRWCDLKVHAVMSCARMNEGIDWVPCSHVYNAGIPAVPGLILQRWGRAARAKGKIAGYPKKWADARTLVFFTPPGTGEGDSWRGQLETAWLLGGFLADYNAAREWTFERQSRGEDEELPIPASNPEVIKWIGRLAEQIERRGGSMTPKEAHLWLAGRAVSSEVACAVVRRTQMLDRAHREQEEGRHYAQGLRVKAERWSDAAPLIEEFATPLRSAGVAASMVRFTALDAKTIAERMQGAGMPLWHGMSLEKMQVFARTIAANSERPPTCHSGRDDALGGFTWAGLDAALHRLGSSLAQALRLNKNEANAALIRAFFEREGYWPRTTRNGKNTSHEAKLGRAMCNLRYKHKDLCLSYGIPLQIDLVNVLTRAQGAYQFGTLGVVVAEVASAGLPPIRETMTSKGSGLALDACLRNADGGSTSRGLHSASDRCQVKTLGRLFSEIRADCWSLTLDDTTAPDPRPWADLLASGDHKRIVKAERVAFLDWANPGKDRKPVRRSWKAPKSAKPKQGRGSA